MGKATKRKSEDSEDSENSTNERKKQKVEEGETALDKKYNYERASARVKSMTVELTGARSGEILQGCSKCSNGGLIRIIGNSESFIVPPRLQRIEEVEFFPELWERFMKKISAVPFFSVMTEEEIRDWLVSNASDKEIDIADLEGCVIELIQPGKNFSERVENATELNNFISAEEVLASDIKALVPHKENSRAKSATLYFYHSMWKIEQCYDVSNYHNGKTPYYDVINAKCVESSKETCKDDEVFYEIGREAVFKANKLGVQQFTFDYIIDEVCKRIHPFKSGEIEGLEEATRGFTCAAYKSLVQKLIRFKPSQVSAKDLDTLEVKKEYPTKVVLLYAMCKLLVHPGAMQLQIQKFVTGLESFTKRMVIIAFEDSYVNESEVKTVVQLIMSSFLTQKCKAWKPSTAMIRDWFLFGLALLKEDRCLEFDAKNGASLKPYTLDSSSTRKEPMRLVSAFLDKVNGMKGDLNFIRDIASRSKGSTLPEPLKARKIQEITMPLEHCIDQHWIANIVYYIDESIVREHCSDKKNKKSAPFETLLANLFRRVTGINPRRQEIGEEDGFVKTVRQAQLACLVSIQFEGDRERQVEEEIYEITGELDNSWLAGLVGPVKIKLKNKEEVFVTLHPNNIYKLAVMRAPTIRAMKKEDLSPEQEKEAIDDVLEQLRYNGLSLSSSHCPIEKLVGTRVTLEESKESGEESYQINYKDFNMVSWDKERRYELTVPCLSKDRELEDIISCIKHNNTFGIEINIMDKLETLLEKYSSEVVQRSIPLLSTNNKTIEFETISRNGGGTKLSVVPSDVPTFQLLLKLSVLCPAAFSVSKHKTASFNVKSLPVLWYLRDIVKSLAKKEDDLMREEYWDNIEDTERTLHLHQREALEELKERDGKKGHFLWLTAGAGKTKIVFEYIRHLIIESRLPEYLVYTCPASAVEAIEHELSKFGFEYKLMKKRDTVEKFTVLLVQHDDMRTMEEELLSIAPRCFFVNDECHYTLNDTKRTSIALDMARLSKEFIALTGTPIIDNKVVKLVPWLEQIVDFAVNAKNIYVAANGMISHLYNTGVVVHSHEIHAGMRNTEKDRHKELVPIAIGGTNTSTTYDDLKKASEICYKAITRKMIKLVKSLVEEERRVFVVAKSKEQQKKIFEAVNKSVKHDDILLLEKSNRVGVHFTEKDVEEGNIHDYKVVIATLKHCTGYSVTRCDSMVKCTSPSNQATREQIEHRINRMGQTAESIDIFNVSCGLIDHMRDHHNQSASYSAAFKSMTKKYGQ